MRAAMRECPRLAVVSASICASVRPEHIELLYGVGDLVKEAFNRDLAQYLQLLYDDLTMG